MWTGAEVAPQDFISDEDIKVLDDPGTNILNYWETVKEHHPTWCKRNG